MTQPTLEQEFDRRAPWFTQWWVDGVAYGGTYPASADWRVDDLFQRFGPLRAILELGSMEGGHTLNMAGRAGVEKVVGLEGRPINLERAEFVKKLYQAHNVSFFPANLEKADLTTWGTFDCVFCVGLLYHLPEPWKLIEKIAKVTSKLYLWTHVGHEHLSTLQVRDKRARVTYRGQRYKEHGLADVLSGMSKHSFWPDLPGLKTMLSSYGFGTITIIEQSPGHEHGPALTLAATKGP